MRAFFPCGLWFMMVAVTAITAAPPELRLPAPARPVPQPMPPLSTDAPTKLTRGQFYVIGSKTPLLVDAICGTGTVAITERRTTLTIPTELAVGYSPDPNDPDFITFTDDYLYIIKAGDKSGPVSIAITPSVNGVELDKDGKFVKQIPLKRTDITHRTLAIESGIIPVDPVTPTDALTTALQTAFNAESGTFTGADGKMYTRAECVSKLAALYANAAKTTANNPDVKTYGDLFKILKTASETMLPPTAIPGVRAVVGKHVNGALTTPPDASPRETTPIDRATTITEFTTISNALRGVK